MPELVAARTAYSKGRIEECRAQLKAARVKAENLPPVDLMLARLHFSHNKAAAGKQLLEEVAVAEANHPEVYLLFGNVALNEGRLTDAMLHFERSMNVGIPEEWTDDQKVALAREAFSGLAAVAEKRGDWYKAQVALKQLTKINPGDAKIRDRLGAALFMLGREEEAFDQFQTAARQDANMNEPEVSMAVMHLRRQEYEKAAQAFQNALQKYPNDGRICYEAAGMHLLTDNAQQAKRLADKAAALGLDTRELKMQRGYIARQLRDYEAAEKHFSAALAQSPADFEAINQLALVLAEQDDEAKQQRALELATLNVRRYPKSAPALSTSGWVYYKLGRKDEARRALQLAAAQPQVRSETLYYLARLLWESGDKDDARKVAARVQEAVEQPGLFVLRPEIKRWFAATAIN